MWVRGVAADKRCCGDVAALRTRSSVSWRGVAIAAPLAAARSLDALSGGGGDPDRHQSARHRPAELKPDQELMSAERQQVENTIREGTREGISLPRGEDRAA
jgi:hypothetical protein